MLLAAFFDNLWNHLHSGFSFWTIFGLVGNVMFTSRFVVQWYASEKCRQSIIPANFWHLSLVGGVIQLIYALHLGFMPVILGALLPPVIAARNLVLIARHGERPPPARRPDGLPPPPRPAPRGVSPELASR